MLRCRNRIRNGCKDIYRVEKERKKETIQPTCVVKVTKVMSKDVSRETVKSDAQTLQLWPWNSSTLSERSLCYPSDCCD